MCSSVPVLQYILSTVYTSFHVFSGGIQEIITLLFNTGEKLYNILKKNCYFCFLFLINNH